MRRFLLFLLFLALGACSWLSIVDLGPVQVYGAGGCLLACFFMILWRAERLPRSLRRPAPVTLQVINGGRKRRGD